MPQSTNIMHWSSEARRQAAASALEAKRVASQRDAGSAKVSILPPKVRPARRGGGVVVAVVGVS